MTDGTEKCNPKIEENQREDRRAFRKFIVLLLAAMVVGGITGAFSTMAAKGQADIGAGITAGLQKIAPYANLVIAAALAVWMTGMLRGARAEYRRWDGEEEQLLEKIERKLGIGVIVTNVALIAGFFFFAAGMKSTGIDSGWEEEIPWVKIAATFLGLIAVMVVTVIAQNRIVNFTKEINPEKKGSVYDLKFQKTWIASCDEAEQLQIYRAAFRAYTAMNYAALGMFLVCFIGMLSWHFGLLPITMVLFVWLTGVIAYGVESLRMTGGR